MKYLFFASIVLLFSSCKTNPSEVSNTLEVTDDSLLTRVQYQTFQYFWENAEPTSGLAPERTHMDGYYPQNDQHIVTTGGSGFGLMALVVGIERNFISRQEGLERFEKITSFLASADRFHGAWPHWINGQTGRVQPFSPKDDGGDLVETAFLIHGLLAVKEYFKNGNEREKELCSVIDKLWREVEWSWYTHGENVLYWHWSPNYGWEMNFPVGGYNECLIMYVLAAASPTYPINPEVYHEGWTVKGQITKDTTYLGIRTILNHYEHANDPVGPLFWAHYSYLGLDPRKLKDRYADYWTLNQNHALIHYEYCKSNPQGFKGYGEDCWGLTSSYSMSGYAGHRPTEDLGVISPTAALSSFPYTPQQSMDFLRYLYTPGRDSLIGKYGPYDAFSISSQWMLPHYLAIDQGPIPVMIENYRTGLIWNLTMQNEDLKNGLNILGFTY